jgi:outer membrane protein W
VNRLVLLSLLVSSFVPSLALAEDAITDTPVDATVDVPVAAPDAPEKPKRKKFYFRAGVAHIATMEKSDPMELSDVDGAASLALQNGPIEGSGASVSSATIVGIIVGYVLPWGNDKLSVETILGLPFKVTFKATGTLATESLAPTALGLPTGVPALGPELAEAKAVPIVATLVYQLPALGKVTPYIGGGPAIMFATGEKVTNMQLTAVDDPEMSISPSPGLVFQGGLDAQLTGRFYARLDVKFMLMKAHATVKHIQVETPDLPLFGNTEVGTANMSMWLNPLVLQAGIGADF